MIIKHIDFNNKLFTLEPSCLPAKNNKIPYESSNAIFHQKTIKKKTVIENQFNPQSL